MAAPNPTFLFKNYINNVSQITDNTGGATTDPIKLRLFDRDVDIQYQTTGVDTGNRTVTIDFGSVVNIDTIFIQNHNMEDFTIKGDGGVFIKVPGISGNEDINLTGNSAANVYYDTVPVGTQTIEINCTNIFGGVSGILKIGEIYIGQKIFRMADETGGDLEIQPRTAQKLIPLSDETVQKLFVRRTVNYSMELNSINKVELQNYIRLFSLNRTSSFAFVPRPPIALQALTNIWDGLGGHYQWANSDDIYEFTDIPSDTFNVNIELLQAGGLE